jgi:hypothetical protein
MLEVNQNVTTEYLMNEHLMKVNKMLIEETHPAHNELF